VKKILIPFLVLSLTFSLSCCASNTPRQNKVIGATVGGAAGAGLGAASGASPGAITLVGTGAIVGALIGASYGNPMEESDKNKAYRVIASGKPATWQNPESKISYTVIPASHYVTFDDNPNCRQFTAQQMTSDGEHRKIQRIACRGAHGDWQLVH
jgi:surface antigen